MSTKKAKQPRRPKPNPARPETWPIIWRVVEPAAGSYDHDMVFIETEDEAEARSCFKHLRRQRFPVRLERIACGPLPVGFRAPLTEMRNANPQAPGTKLREIAGAWEAPP